jgi:hypothetical protein
MFAATLFSRDEPSKRVLLGIINRPGSQVEYQAFYRWAGYEMGVARRLRISKVHSPVYTLEGSHLILDA